MRILRHVMHYLFWWGCCPSRGANALSATFSPLKRSFPRKNSVVNTKDNPLKRRHHLDPYRPPWLCGPWRRWDQRRRAKALCEGTVHFPSPRTPASRFVLQFCRRHRKDDIPCLVGNFFPACVRICAVSKFFLT